MIIDNGALSFRWKVVRCVSALTYLCRLCRIACRLVRRVVGCAGDLYRDYGIGERVFTLEDQGGRRGLLYLLERKRFGGHRPAGVGSVRARLQPKPGVRRTRRSSREWCGAQTVDECLVRACQVGEERLSRSYYALAISVRCHHRLTLRRLSNVICAGGGPAFRSICSTRRRPSWFAG